MQNWIVIRPRPHKSTACHDSLIAAGCAVFFPRMETRSIRRGQLVIGEVPLFPGYAFVQEFTGILDVLRSSRYVSGVLQLGGTMARIKPSAISELQAVVGESGVLALAPDGPKFLPGQSVIVDDGPFGGLAGKFQSMSAGRRCKVLLHWLGRDVVADVDVSQLKKVA